MMQAKPAMINVFLQVCNDLHKSVAYDGERTNCSTFEHVCCKTIAAYLFFDKKNCALEFSMPIDQVAERFNLKIVKWWNEVRKHVNGVFLLDDGACRYGLRVEV